MMKSGSPGEAEVFPSASSSEAAPPHVDKNCYGVQQKKSIALVGAENFSKLPNDSC